MKKKSDTLFDELNSLDNYYEPMQIDIGSKARRRELAEYLTDAFLFFFSTYEVYRTHRQFGIIQKDACEILLANEVSNAVTKVTGIDSYMSQHIREMSKEVVNTTFEKARLVGSGTENLNSPKTKTPINHISVDKTLTNPTLLIDQPIEASASPSHVDDSSDSNNQDYGYWLSYKRAEDIAKSEANTFLNYTDFVEAKERGATKKRWLTMLDDKVRQTHSDVEGETIDIDEVFYVGNSQMRFPHDLAESPDPKEVIGCRCAVEYL